MLASSSLLETSITGIKFFDQASKNRVGLRSHHYTLSFRVISKKGNVKCLSSSPSSKPVKQFVGAYRLLCEVIIYTWTLSSGFLNWVISEVRGKGYVSRPIFF